METPNRYVPIEFLAEAILYGKKLPDPQNVEGASKYLLDIYKNKKLYQLEVVYQEANKTILHFLYK